MRVDVSFDIAESTALHSNEYIVALCSPENVQEALGSLVGQHPAPADG